MNSPAKKTKNKGHSMIPVLSPNGLAGIAPGIGIKNENFNGCLSIHQEIAPIIYFDIKNEWLFPSEKRFSNTSKLTSLCPSYELHPEIRVCNY